MQMNTDQEKEITLNVHDPSQLSAFVSVISTQPPATAHLPAETRVVTMVKMFTNVTFHFTTFLLSQDLRRTSPLTSFNNIFQKSQNRGQSLATSVLHRWCLSLRYMPLESQRGAVGESECVGLVREEQKEASMYRVCLRSQLKTLTASIHSWLHNSIAVIVL